MNHNTMYIKMFKANYSYPCLFFSKKHHKNDDGSQPKLEEFKDDIFFLPEFFNETDKIALDTDQYYATILGYEPKFEYVDSLASILPNIESGQGVSILTNYCRIRKSSLISSIPLDASANIVFAWNKNNDSQLVKRLLADYIK